MDCIYNAVDVRDVVDDNDDDDADADDLKL